MHPCWGRVQTQAGGNRFFTGRELEESRSRAMKNERMEKGRGVKRVAAGRLEVFQLYREMEYVITEAFPLTKYENVSIHIVQWTGIVNVDRFAFDKSREKASKSWNDFLLWLHDMPRLVLFCLGKFETESRQNFLLSRQYKD